MRTHSSLACAQATPLTVSWVWSRCARQRHARVSEREMDLPQQGSAQRTAQLMSENGTRMMVLRFLAEADLAVTHTQDAVARV